MSVELKETKIKSQVKRAAVDIFCEWSRLGMNVKSIIIEEKE